jgi:ferredoxin-type protein NapH
MRKWLIIRRIVQFSAIALLFLPFVMDNPFWFGTYISSQFLSISLTDPLAALEVFLAGKSFYWPLFWSVVPIVIAALILGRMFCGWICPVNTLIETAYSIKQPPAPKKGADTWAPYYVLASVLIISLIFSIPFFTMISPIGSLSRVVAFGIGIELLLVLAILIGEWVFGKKAWCRLICPAGAMYGLIGRYRLLGVNVDKNACINCQNCRKVCSMQVNPASNTPLHVMNCTNCADCITNCAKGALKFDFKVRQS